MNVLSTLKTAFDALVRNRARSLLTMLGVVIGVAAVIVTVAIGAGARVSVQQQISSLGSNLIIVLPGSVTQKRHPDGQRRRIDAHAARHHRNREAARRRVVREGVRPRPDRRRQSVPGH